MRKKILIINTGNSGYEFYESLKSLESEMFSFLLLSRQNINSGQQYNWRMKKISRVTAACAKMNSFLFLLALPVFYIFSFFIFISLKWKEKFSTIFCLQDFEKLIFTPIAKLISLKVVWLFAPEYLMPKNKFLMRILVFYSRWAKIIVPTGVAKDRLKKSGINENSIYVIPVGIIEKNYGHQENIFSKIAAAETRWPQRKYFTIGTAVDLDQKHNIETLFNATKKISDVISYPQIIILGEGKEKKNLSLLAKRMGIENCIWFVGEHKKLKKWLESFDVFVVTAHTLKLKDLNIISHALASGLPLIASNDSGVEDMVLNNENGIIIESENSEDLAQAIIKLQQRKDWRKLLGEKSKKVSERFKNDKILADLKAII